LCLLVGAASGGVTEAGVKTWYPTLAAPPGTPPNWVFAPVWTVLFVMMGVGAWLVWRQPLHRPALRLWGWQLAVNAAWSQAFFGLHSTALGLAVILPMLLLIALTIRAFARIHTVAAGLLVPYIAWTGYATYLNLGFWWLNHV
jgi:tryptophan-rich sensory protein